MSDFKVTQLDADLDFGSLPSWDVVIIGAGPGGFGYGEVKKALADLAEAYFAQARRRRAELESHPEQVHEILADGARKARRKAAEVLSRAQQACGVRYDG